MKPILLVEDNEDDVIFMKRAFKTAQIHHPLQVVMDGQAAIDYFARVSTFSDPQQSALPCLVLLDLKLPNKHGLEVLDWLRHQEHLRTLIVIILSTSREPNDLRRAYQIGANAYLVKPAEVSQLFDMVKAIKLFWLTYNEFLV